LNELIDFAEKDSNNVEIFENLLENLSFKKFEEDDLKKIQKKKEWLKKNSVWKKKLKKMEDESSSSDKSDSDSDKSDSDSDKSDSDSDKSTSDSDKSSSESSSSSEEEENKIAEVDIKNSSLKYIYNKKSKEIYRNNGNSGWDGSIISKKPTDKFAILFVKGGINFIYGFIDIKAYGGPNTGNYK
jgi:hypothetical protein